MCQVLYRSSPFRSTLNTNVITGSTCKSSQKNSKNTKMPSWSVEAWKLQACEAAALQVSKLEGLPPDAFEHFNSAFRIAAWHSIGVDGTKAQAHSNLRRGLWRPCSFYSFPGFFVSFAFSLLIRFIAYILLFLAFLFACLVLPSDPPFLPSYLPSFLPFFLLAFFLSFLPSSLPSFCSCGFIFSWCSHFFDPPKVFSDPQKNVCFDTYPNKKQVFDSEVSLGVGKKSLPPTRTSFIVVWICQTLQQQQAGSLFEKLRRSKYYTEFESTWTLFITWVSNKKQRNGVYDVYI